MCLLVIVPFRCNFRLRLGCFSDFGFFLFFRFRFVGTVFFFCVYLLFLSFGLEPFTDCLRTDHARVVVKEREFGGGTQFAFDLWWVWRLSIFRSHLGQVSSARVSSRFFFYLPVIFFFHSFFVFASFGVARHALLVVH